MQGDSHPDCVRSRRKVEYGATIPGRTKSAQRKGHPVELTLDDVRHIAALARVRFTDDELETMRRQLSDILVQFTVLERVDTDGVEPTGHASGITSVMRPDDPRPSIAVEDALANAPLRQEDFVRVRAVLQDTGDSTDAD